MIAGKSKNVLWYILIVTIIQNETLQQNVGNKSEINNKNNWMHYLQERLQKGNSEYEDDDKPTMKTPIIRNLQENWKSPQIKSTNHEDFMQYFLRNNLYNKNNKNLQLNNNNNNNNNMHLYHPKNPDNSFEFINKYDIITKKNYLQKSEKRNANKAKNENKVISTSEEENNKLNYDKDYDTDMDTQKMTKLDNIFGNIIKDITNTNNETYLKSNTDIIENNELQTNNEDVNYLYTVTTERPSMKTCKPSSNEPKVQVLNITQVFNTYSKLIPLKKYIEALNLEKRSEIERNKNYFDKENGNLSPPNQSNENDVEQRLQYALIKELLTNLIRNSTDIDQLIYNNDNYDDSNALNSLHSINKIFNFNPFLLPPKHKSINSNNKVKISNIKKLNNDNDRILNAIKDIIFKSIANNDENDDSINMNKLKWKPSFYETVNQYA